MDTPIFDFVRSYAESGVSRLHMPGHKGSGPLGCESLDITEIHGADSLFEASGIIARSERNASALFGTRGTFYSTEGSTHCIKAMLTLAAVYGGKHILAARNVHKSFVHAAALLDIDVDWIFSSRPAGLLSCPLTGGDVEQALKNARAPVAAVYITSPDYLGIMQPIDEISEVCGRFGVPLLVDNAHGAYLRFLPDSLHPMDHGACMCCDSAHKTLPVLTGGAYLHTSCHPCAGDVSAVRRALSLFGSTSPSYLILQSLDLCNDFLSKGFKKALADTAERVAAIKKALIGLGWSVENTEPLKITVRACASGFTGAQLADRLRSFGVECEYSDGEYVVLMFSPHNRDIDYRRVLSAFPESGSPVPVADSGTAPSPVMAMSIRRAVLSQCEEIPVSRSVGRVCSSPALSCPPAVPIAVSGELISEDVAALLLKYGVSTVSVVK